MFRLQVLCYRMRRQKGGANSCTHEHRTQNTANKFNQSRTLPSARNTSERDREEFLASVSLNMALRAAPRAAPYLRSCLGS